MEVYYGHANVSMFSAFMKGQAKTIQTDEDAGSKSDPTKKLVGSKVCSNAYHCIIG